MRNKISQALFGLYVAADEGVANPFFKDVIGPLFGSQPKSPAKASSIGELVLVVIQVLLLVAASVAVIFLIIGGYRYVISHGNEEAAEAAKKTITSSILGLVIIILAFTIISLISRILLEGVPGTGIQ